MEVFVVFAGTKAVVVTAPVEQETVVGRPLTAVLDDEKVQLMAFATVAANVTDPPRQGTGEGVAAKPEIDGRGAALTVMVVEAEVLALAFLATTFTE